MLIISGPSVNLASLQSIQHKMMGSIMIAARPRILIRQIRGADCCVIGTTGELTPDWCRAISMIRSGSSTCHIVAVTNPDAGVTRQLYRLGIDDVFWHEEIADYLIARYGTAKLSGRDYLRTFCSRFTQIDKISDALLHVLLTSTPPPRSVNELSLAVGLNRRTVWHHWNAAARQGAPSLKRMLQVVQLLYAIEQRGLGRSWMDAAEDCDVTLLTITRLAKRLGFANLQALDAAGPSDFSVAATAYLAPGLRHSETV